MRPDEPELAAVNGQTNSGGELTEAAESVKLHRQLGKAPSRKLLLGTLSRNSNCIKISCHKIMRFFLYLN